MNPIENLFGILKQLWFEAMEKKTIAEKLQFLMETRIPQETVNALIDSMPRRLAALKKARGHHTKY